MVSEAAVSIEERADCKAIEDSLTIVFITLLQRPGAQDTLLRMHLRKQKLRVTVSWSAPKKRKATPRLAFRRGN